MEEAPDNSLQELILVDKPVGLSSFDVIRVLRKRYGKVKMGHAGTLDPRASGLMLVGLGKGTKKLKDLIGLPKVYEAEVLLGKKTDSGDLEGEVTLEQGVPELSTDQIAKELEGMVGKLTLPAPIYSALKRGGESLYKKARRGEKVEPSIVEMEVLEASLIGYNKPTVKVRFNVGSGTYIRSLAEELGERLGTVATLSGLRRISVGEYKVEDAISLD